MAERQTRSQFFRKSGELILGGFVTFGLLGGPVVLAIGYRRQQDLLKEMSTRRRYEVSVSEAVQIPPFVSLMPPIAVPGRTETRNNIFYINGEPITEVDGGQYQYTLRDAIRSSQDGSSLEYLREYIVVNPASFVVKDRFQEVK